MLCGYGNVWVMHIHKNNSKNDAKLTIASPYLNDDPSPWIRKLISSPLAKDVQIILIDDGTNNDEADKNICALLNEWPGSAIRLRLKKNAGRSRARNFAIEHAMAEYILFIDADMVPAYDDFLERYFEIIDKKSAAVVFGGFEVPRENVAHDLMLCYDLAMRSDCQPAHYRSNRGAYAVASNNLMALKKVFETEPFDPTFKGWGWEDTEWAIRVTNSGFGLLHIDNPALHHGLDTSQTMLKKYREAGDNLAIMVKKHEFANRFLSVKTAKIVGKLPVHRFMRPIAKFVTLDKLKIMPVFLRRMAIKFWRASWAADSLKQLQQN